MRGEVLRLHISDHFITISLQPVFAEEDDRWRPEDTESFQECLVFLIVGSDIRLQQYRAGQCCLHPCVGECVMLHLQAGNAPVGIEIEHGCLPLTGCLRERLIKVVDGLDSAKLESTMLCHTKLPRNAQA